MARFAVAIAAGALLVGCAAPVVAPAPLDRPPAQPAVAAAWPDDLAVANLRAAFARRGYRPEVGGGVMAPVSFDPARVIVHQDAFGQFTTVAAGGAWLVATDTGTFWIFESGIVLPADQAATR
jgi:hypothetical protein